MAKNSFMIYINRLDENKSQLIKWRINCYNSLIRQLYNTKKTLFTDVFIYYYFILVNIYKVA